MYQLKRVTIGSNVTEIGAKAFYQCSALTSVTIPAKVKKIGIKAFYGNKKLKTIKIKTVRLKNKTVGKAAFKGIAPKAKISVPSKKKKAYKTLLKAKGVPSKATIK